LLGNFGSKEDEMSANKFTDEFKRDAVAQVEDRGYPVREVAERLGVRCPAGECEAIAEREHQVDLHLAEAVFATC
jgi:imidazolonepropionase-like amidohydrolase